jgi:hypothetical protein
MLFNKIIKKYLITNGSSRKKPNVKYIFNFISNLNIIINSYIKEEDWLSIINCFKEDSSHFERIKHCYDLLLKIYKAAKLKRTSIFSNSLIIFHKYYIYSFFTNSPISTYIKEDSHYNKDLAYIAMACFFISLKVSNVLITINFIIDKYCLFEQIQAEDILKIKEKVLAYESDILYINKYSVVNALPYPFLKKILGIGNQAIFKLAIKSSENNNTNTNINNFLLNYDNEVDKINHIKEKISETVNYSFLFPFFLYHSTEIISLSCLISAFNKLNIQINITDIINIINNQKEMDCVSIDVNDINDIEICSSLIDELILSKIEKEKPPQHDNNNINNIVSHEKHSFFISNAEYDAETKSKNELNEKPKKETLLQKKRK